MEVSLNLLKLIVEAYEKDLNRFQVSRKQLPQETKIFHMDILSRQGIKCLLTKSTRIDTVVVQPPFEQILPIMKLLDYMMLRNSKLRIIILMPEHYLKDEKMLKFFRSTSLSIKNIFPIGRVKYNKKYKHRKYTPDSIVELIANYSFLKNKKDQLLIIMEKTTKPDCNKSDEMTSNTDDQHDDEDVPE